MDQPAKLRNTAAAVVFLRIATSLAWLDSAFIGKDAKLSPTFLSGAGLAQAIHEKFLHNALTPGVVNLLKNLVLPHAQVFAPLIAFSDLAIGISLCFGIFTRLGAAIAILRAITNIFVGGGAGPDTIGYNAMLIAASLIAIITGSGRRFGIDRLLLSRAPNSRLLRLLA